MKSYAYKHSETIQSSMMEDKIQRKQLLNEINTHELDLLRLKKERKENTKDQLMKLGNVSVYIFILLYLFGMDSAVIFILPVAPLFVYMIFLFITSHKI